MVASLLVGAVSKVWVTARLSVIGVDRLNVSMRRGASGGTDDIATSRQEGRVIGTTGTRELV